VYASGGAKTVWVNYREERSVALPARVRAFIA
jgi:acyl-CoA thioesterase FadM